MTAQCADLTGLMFATDTDTVDVARRLCSRCRFATRCLVLALVHDERAGVWGGFDAHQRNQIIRTIKARTKETT